MRRCRHKINGQANQTSLFITNGNAQCCIYEYKEPVSLLVVGCHSLQTTNDTNFMGINRKIACRVSLSIGSFMSQSKPGAIRHTLWPGWCCRQGTKGSHSHVCSPVTRQDKTRQDKARQGKARQDSHKITTRPPQDCHKNKGLSL